MVGYPAHISPNVAGFFDYNVNLNANIMKTLADFKRRLVVGTLVETTHAKLGSFGIRPISIVQTNAFALATEKPEGTVNSWCQLPSAKDIEFSDADTAHIYWGEGERRERILTYHFPQPNKENDMKATIKKSIVFQSHHLDAGHDVIVLNKFSGISQIEVETMGKKLVGEIRNSFLNFE